MGWRESGNVFSGMYYLTTVIRINVTILKGIINNIDQLNSYIRLMEGFISYD